MKSEIKLIPVHKTNSTNLELIFIREAKLRLQNTRPRCYCTPLNKQALDHYIGQLANQN